MAFIASDGLCEGETAPAGPKDMLLRLPRGFPITAVGRLPRRHHIFLNIFFMLRTGRARAPRAGGTGVRDAQGDRSLRRCLHNGTHDRGHERGWQGADAR